MSNKFKFAKMNMSKTISYNLVVFLFFVMNFASVFGQPMLNYYLEIDELKWDSFQISISIKDNKNEYLYCTFPGLNSWKPLSKDEDIGISEVNVVGDYGNNLPVSRINWNSWLIESKANNIVIINYKIKKMTDDVLGECLNRRFARIDCGSTFMLIRELSHVPIRISARVPHRWKLATGLPFSNDQFEYSAADYAELLNRPIYMAPFVDLFFPIQDRICYLVFDGKKNFDVLKLTNIAKKIVNHQVDMFGDIPFNSYLFIFKLFPDERIIASKAYENSSIIYLSSQTSETILNELGKQMASNFFQSWNGYQFHPTLPVGRNINSMQPDRYHWIINGVSDYYGYLTMARTGLLIEDEVIQNYIHLMNQSNQIADFQNISVASLCADGFRYWDRRTIEHIRIKGHLIGALLDLKIRAMTDNRRSLDDVMYFLNKWFGTTGQAYSEQDLLRAINSVAEINVASFFDQYISGTVELPFSELFQHAGIFIKSELDTIPDLGQVILSNITNEVLSLEKSGSLAIAGLQRGDRLLSFANQKIHAAEQIEQIADTLSIDQYVDFSIQRDKLFLMLSAKVKGKSGKRYFLTGSVPQTDSQRIIRKSWLSAQPD